MYAIHQSNFFITFINLGPGTFLLVKGEVLRTRLNLSTKNSLVFGLFTTRTFFNSSLRLTLSPMKFLIFRDQAITEPDQSCLIEPHFPRKNVILFKRAHIEAIRLAPVHSLDPIAPEGHSVFQPGKSQ